MTRRLLCLAALCSVLLLPATGFAQGHPPHPPHPPMHQPPVIVPPPTPPTVPPVLRTPKPPTQAPGAAAASRTDAASGIDPENVPPFTYRLGDSGDIAALYEPPKVPMVDAFFCDFVCNALQMFPGDEEQVAVEKYEKWIHEQNRLIDRGYELLRSGEAIPEGLRLGGYIGFDDVRLRVDEDGVKRFYVSLVGMGQEAVFSVAVDDIGGGIAANIDKVRSVAGHTAGHIKSEAEWNRSRAESFNEDSYTESYRKRADLLEALLDKFSGPIIERAPTSQAATSTGGPSGPVVADTAGPTDGAPVNIPADAAPDAPIVPAPSFDDPVALVDAIAANDTQLFDPQMIGGWGESDTGPVSDAALRELIRTSRDFGGGEVMIDIDVVDTGNLGALADAMVGMGVDAGLAVAGAVNPAAGITIAFGKNAKETYDYAISKGLSTKQAIFAATTAGAVGGADTYIVGMGIGKVAGWVGPALKSGTRSVEAATEAAEHGIGTAGNASGFSLVGNVGKALVDKIATNNKNRPRYDRPRRTLPTGPADVTVVMSGGPPWQQNAVQ